MNVCCGSLMLIQFTFYLFTNVSRADVYTLAAPLMHYTTRAQDHPPTSILI